MGLTPLNDDVSPSQPSAPALNAEPEVEDDDAASVVGYGTDDDGAQWADLDEFANIAGVKLDAEEEVVVHLQIACDIILYNGII